MGRTDKNGQCALVHAALKGHAEIINILLGQDWGTEITSDPPPPQHPDDQNVTLKMQAVQQALTAAASLGHTQARISPEGKKKKWIWIWISPMCNTLCGPCLGVDLLGVVGCCGSKSPMLKTKRVKLCVPAGGEEHPGTKRRTAGSADGCPGCSLGRNWYTFPLSQINLASSPLSVYGCSGVTIRVYLKPTLAVQQIN